MKLKDSVALITFMTLTSLGCGDNGSPTAPVVPSMPARASIAVSLIGNPVLNFGIVRNFSLSYSIKVVESAGLGANMNFIRLEARIGTVVVERQEIGSGSIISQTGSNRIEGGSTKDFTITQEFNEGRADNILLTVNFTDDRGNSSDHEVIVVF